MNNKFLYPKKPVIPNINNVDNAKFNAMFKKKMGLKIWSFLCVDVNIIRMIDAAHLKRASVDPLSNDIEMQFNLSKNKEMDEWKKYIGYMIKIIMRANGYIVYSKGNRIISSKIFVTGARYEKF
jgi:hypothetical protein